jgi:hypothetical protein
MACLASDSVADIPTPGREFGEVAQAPPQARVVPGMTRRAVERLLKEEPAWSSGWLWCGGQYWASYLQAGVRVYFDPDDRVLRVADLWAKPPEGGMIHVEGDDW